MFARFFLFAAFIVILYACKKSGDDNFILAYAELRITEREYWETEGVGAEDGKAARIQILQKYGFSLADFENEVQGIKKDPRKWLEFQNKLIKALDSIIDYNIKTRDET